MENETDLEYQVLASSFRTPGAISYFRDELPAHILGGPGKAGLEQLYAALLDYHKQTKVDPVDVVTFKYWIQHETEIAAAVGGMEMVDLLFKEIHTLDLAQPESLVAMLKSQDRKRQQLQCIKELEGLVTKGKIDDVGHDRISYLSLRINDLDAQTDYNPLDRVVTGHDIALGAESLWEIPDFVPTQYPALNKALGYDEVKGGMFKGAIHAIIAQSGRGKSTLAKALVNHWMDNGHRCLFINYEEPRALWERVLLTQITKKNVYLGASDIEKYDLTKKFKAKMEEWGDRFMVRHDPDTPFFDELEDWLRDLNGSKAPNPDIVVIDTIQSLFIRASRGQRWGQFEEMMVRLEKLARDMGAVFIITAQENTDRMKEGRSVVRQSDTGGSISIQQKSAVTMFITERQSTVKDDSIDKTIMEIQIAKNRITGSTFSTIPTLIKYNDDIKSFEPYEFVTDDAYPEIPAWLP